MPGCSRSCVDGRKNVGAPTFGAVFTSARRGPSPNSTIHSVGRSRVDACGRRDQPESRSYKTRECRDESACIRRASRGPRQGRARCADRESDRCAGEDHEYQHLRVGSTHVRRPHRSGARNGPSVTKTWASSPKSAMQWSKYRQGIECACRSTSAAASAETARKG